MSREKQLEKLVVMLEARTAKYQQQLENSKKKSKKWSIDTQRDTDKVAKSFALAAAAGVTALAVIYSKSAVVVDQLGKLSDKLGETPQKLMALQHAASETGVSVDTTNMALQRMVRRTSEAARGTGEAVNALKELGIDAKELAKQSPADQFATIAEAMKGVGSQGDRVRLAMKLFDSEGVALVNTLKLGKQGLEDAQEELRGLGLELSRVDISMVEAANDEFDLLKKTFAGFGNKLAVEFAPIVEEISNEFLNVAREAGGVGVVAGKVFDYIAIAAGAIGNTLFYLEVGFKTIQLAIQGVGVGAITLFSTIVRGYTELANLIPGIDIDYNSTFLGKLEKDVQDGLKVTQDELNSMVLSEMPSAKIAEWVLDVQSKARAIAKKKKKDDQSAGNVDSGPDLSDGVLKLKNFESLMDEYADVSANAASYIEDSFTTAFDSMTNNMSRGLAQAIVEGESLKDVFGQVAKTLAVDMVASLIKVGAQMLINAAFGKASQAEQVIAANVVGPAVATAWAPAAALVSLATLGSNAVPAQTALGSTVALSAGLAGMAHDGIDNIPKEGTWLLDKGERVLSAGQNKEFSEFMKQGSGQSVNITNVFQISAGVEGTVQAEIKKTLPSIDRLLQNSIERAIRSGGSLARAVGARS